MTYNTPRTPSVGQKISASWGRSLIDSIRAGLPVAAPGMLLKRGMYGTSMTPMVEAKSGGVAIGGASPLLPFKVRWFAKPTELNPDAGEWQVYVPFGSLTVVYGDGTISRRAYSAMATNADAKDAEGNAIYRWFKIPDPEDVNAEVKIVGEKAVKQWTVYVLTKPWARLLVSTDPDGNGNVAWRDAIATISIAEWTEQTEDGRSVYQMDHNVIPLNVGHMEKRWDVVKPFAIDYKLSDETSADSEYAVEVINQTKMLGRLQAKNIEPVNVKGATEVWVQIDHSGEDFDLTVKTSVQNEESDDDVTVYKIYDLEDGVVTEDYRDTIPELPFYTNPAQ